MLPLAILFVLPLCTHGFVSESTADLTSKVLSKVHTNNDNIVFAPLSIVIGMGMLYQGLGGTSKTNVGRELGFPSQQQQFEQGFMDALPTTTNGSATFANMITVENTAKISNKYGTAVKKIFSAQPFRHSFAENPEKATRSINMWVANHSNKKITDLMPPGSIGTNTKVVLVNVIHFKSAWKEPFTDTFKSPFALSNGREVETDMMVGRKTTRYQSVPGKFEVLHLDFEDPDYMMTIVLPEKGKSISSTLTSLSKSDLLTLVSDPDSLPTTAISVEMPKFEHESRLKLRDTLLATHPGMSEIFDFGADFSNMVEDSQGFAVDEFHHKAIIEVDESGVEATGATGVSIILRSGVINNIVIDRPFIYYIVDKQRNNILFAGVFNKP